MGVSWEQELTAEEQSLLAGLDTPAAIQAFLDQTEYSAESANRNPIRVLRERKAHCLDGATFAVFALRRLGYPPLIVDLLPEPDMDDDHVLAIFKRGNRFGAVAKSNFVGLRYREPVYASLRELAMSYFESYYNVNGQKTLRAYTLPINLKRFDRDHWMQLDSGVDAIEKYLYTRPRIALITAEMGAALLPMDKLSYDAGLLAVNAAGLYKPKR